VVGEALMVDEIKTTWRIPKELVKKFKHLATDRETNVTMLVIEAMEKYLEIQKEPLQFDKNSHKSDIDYPKKEELLTVMYSAKGGELVTSLIEELKKYLETLEPLWSDKYFFRSMPNINDLKKEELAKKVLHLATDRETRVATVKQAMKEYLEKPKK
jgi:hypothetical protein